MSRRVSLLDPPPADALRLGPFALSLFTLAQQPVAKIWRGRMRRPFAFYLFRSTESRERWLDAVRRQADAYEIALEDRKRQERASLTRMLADLQVGAVLASSWGYDQTNVDFYQVVERKPRSVVLRAIANRVEATGDMTATVYPSLGAFTGAPFVRRIASYGVSVERRGRRIARPVDPERGHFSSSYA